VRYLHLFEGCSNIRGVIQDPQALGRKTDLLVAVHVHSVHPSRLEKLCKGIYRSVSLPDGVVHLSFLRGEELTGASATQMSRHLDVLRGMFRRAQVGECLLVDGPQSKRRLR
jgi:hypothetical protein